MDTDVDIIGKILETVQYGIVVTLDPYDTLLAVPVLESGTGRLKVGTGNQYIMKILFLFMMMNLYNLYCTFVCHNSWVLT